MVVSDEGDWDEYSDRHCFHIEVLIVFCGPKRGCHHHCCGCGCSNQKNCHFERNSKIRSCLRWRSCCCYRRNQSCCHRYCHDCCHRMTHFHSPVNQVWRRHHRLLVHLRGIGCIGSSFRRQSILLFEGREAGMPWLLRLLWWMTV